MLNTHLRCIAEFLIWDFPPKGAHNESTVVALDYLNPWPKRPTHLFGDKLGHHRAVVNEINWRVSHIATQRASVQSDGPFVWSQVHQQIPKVLATWDAFLVDLAEAHPDRAELFHAKIREALMVYDGWRVATSGDYVTRT